MPLKHVPAMECNVHRCVSCFMHVMYLWGSDRYDGFDEINVISTGLEYANGKDIYSAKQSKTCFRHG